MHNKWTELDDEDLIALDGQGKSPDPAVATPPLDLAKPPAQAKPIEAPIPALPPTEDSDPSIHIHMISPESLQNETVVEEEETDTIYLHEMEEETQQTNMKLQPITVMTGEGAEITWPTPAQESAKK